MRTLVETVGFCHDQNVVHRDLKVRAQHTPRTHRGVSPPAARRRLTCEGDAQPENILLTETGPSGTIKLADFGFARALEKGDVMKTACGTPG